MSKNIKALVNYFKEVRLELSKVVYPKRADVIKLTTIVILISAIFALYLGALDYGFTVLLEKALIFNL